MRVLCVDDNHDAAESLALLLRLVGLQAEAAFDGPSALRTAAWFLPHACVSDISMPGMDGFDLARRLRACAESRPLLLIALTARTTEEDRRRSVEAGFDVHLNKPADPEEVVRLVVSFANRLTVREELLEADSPLIVPNRPMTA
jgi:two-component system, chemotaxis family, CheB/CheR fusion protein